MTFLKTITLVLLVEVSQSFPKFLQHGNIETTVPEYMDSHFESVTDYEKTNVNPTEAAIINQNENRRAVITIRELLESQILKDTSEKLHIFENNNGKSTFIAVEVPKSKTNQHFQSKSKQHSNQILNFGSIDPYEKLLESFIRGIMSRVLQAEIKEVRVEEMYR